MSLALGRLPSGLFPPKKFQAVLESISRKLPPNWALAVDANPDNLWIFYKETKVSTAVATDRRLLQKGLKLFLHVPIFELKLQFYLYQIFNIPVYNTNTKHGIQYEELSEFVAVSRNQESFITLSKEEINQCIQSTPMWICMITRAFHQISTLESCLMSLFYSNKDALKYCTQILVPWKGLYSV